MFVLQWNSDLEMNKVRKIEGKTAVSTEWNKSKGNDFESYLFGGSRNRDSTVICS